MRSEEVRAALSAAYRQPEWATFFEVADGTGMNKRRSADAIAVNMYPSRGLTINGFEIKVDRSDWKRELANPDKAEAIARYCDFWWVAAPKDLIDPKTLPATWGLIEVIDDAKTRIKIQPKQLKSVAVTRGFFAALCRSKACADERVVDVLVERKLATTYGDRQAEVDRKVEAKTREASALIEQHSAFASAVRKFELRGMSEEKILESLAIVRKLGLFNDWGGFNAMAKSLEVASKTMQKLKEELSI